MFENTTLDASSGSTSHHRRLMRTSMNDWKWERPLDRGKSAVGGGLKSPLLMNLRRESTFVTTEIETEKASTTADEVNYMAIDEGNRSDLSRSMIATCDFHDVVQSETLLIAVKKQVIESTNVMNRNANDGAAQNWAEIHQCSNMTWNASVVILPAQIYTVGDMERSNII